MNTYLEFVEAIRKATKAAKSIKHPVSAPAPAPSASADAPVVMIFSPHPDDECLISALPLRMLHENGVRIVNVAVTLGNNRERQQPRLKELTTACEILGFDLQTTAPNGLEHVNPTHRAENWDDWNQKTEVIASIIERINPAAIMVPHGDDWNATHVGTHLLVTDALREISSSPATSIIETEYWGAMSTPNLMIEVPEQTLATQITALSAHVGEISRNPYHISLPAWMQDNVRRGGELIGGQGEAAPDISFATLYRLSHIKENQLVPADDSMIISADDSPAEKLLSL